MKGENRKLLFLLWLDEDEKKKKLTKDSSFLSSLKEKRDFGDIKIIDETSFDVRHMVPPTIHHDVCNSMH